MNRKYKINQVIEEKHSRILDGESPRVLDLFAGCGGISLGFQRAGCKIIAGIEHDQHAARSHATNFHSHEKNFELHATNRDITQTEPYKFMSSIGYQAPLRAVDIIVGGPPCPPFTRVGRAKLREVNRHPQAHQHDPRTELYLSYLNFVEKLQPLAFLMENVPDLLNFSGRNVAEEICESFEDMGYNCAYTLLNAANYGVPQMRERFFLIGIHEQTNITPQFPNPTHFVDLPQGYHSSRSVALKHVKEKDLFNEHRFIGLPITPNTLTPAVTVRDAIGDLPPITEHLSGKMKRGARRFNKPIEYKGQGLATEYVENLRSWPGFEGPNQIFDHVTRSLSQRDYRLFRDMSPGDDYPKAYALAQTLFEEHLASLPKKRRPKPNSADYEEMKKSFVPPYSPNKFPNKWRKMDPLSPARTLMAHLGKDSYTHIHYDSAQSRVLTVREAARLQSFPDGFTFCGTMNPAFRQIGNAVPPLMSLALAKKLLGSLKKQNKSKGQNWNYFAEGQKSVIYAGKLQTA